MSVFIHQQAICESGNIGRDTRIWAFAHILPGAVIGSDCNICDGVFIENDVKVGDRVTVKCGVQLWDGISVEDDVFIGPNVTFSNDRFPRSKHYPTAFEKTLVCEGSSIGANATVLPGVIIGRRAMVGAGAVVTRSVPPNAIVVGNPARIIGYVDAAASDDSGLSEIQGNETVRSTAVKRVTWHKLNYVKDLRGNLSVGEFLRDIPFEPKRYFLVFDVPSEKTRGQHAHRTCHQFLICVKGTCAVVVDDGENRQEIPLTSPGHGVFMPAMTWGIQYKYSHDAVLLVFASEYYDASDYIRDYDEFISLVKSGKEV